jgi:protein-disulfide isomerase
MNRRRSILTLAAVSISPILFVGRSAFSEDTADIAKRLLEAASPLGDRSLGKVDAPVVMIEYASATCPHCAEFHEKLLPQIKAEYIDTGKVRFIFREFPLDQLALGAFMLARCVPEDKYFPVIDLMFRRQRTWAQAKNPADELFKVTQMAGMDQAAFEACTKRQDLAKAIVESSQKAAKDFGIKGTPAVFVNGQFVDAHEDMPAVKAALDKAINQ